jgi:hypothetical protein
MRLKFFGQRGHWNRWPEVVGVGFGLVASFGGRAVEEPPLGLELVLVLALLFFPAFRVLLLLLGAPSISISGIAQTGDPGGDVGVENES